MNILYYRLDSIQIPQIDAPEIQEEDEDRLLDMKDINMTNAKLNTIDLYISLGSNHQQRNLLRRIS